MLAAKFVESQVKQWLIDSRPNLYDPSDFLPKLSGKIIEYYEQYRKEVAAWPINEQDL